jgi:hypothetical protein
MSSFVYDGTGLPVGRTDAGDEQSVTAAEWNIAMQAIADVRAAITGGAAQSLTAVTDTIMAPGPRVYVSPLTDLKLTSEPSVAAGAVSGHELQIINVGTKLLTLRDSAALRGSTLSLRSAELVLAPHCSVTLLWTGSDWTELSRATYGTADTLHVRDFNAMGTAVTDDSSAIQAALDAAAAQGKLLVFEPRTYAVAFSLNVKCQLDGRGAYLKTVPYPDWKISTCYKIGERRQNGGNAYECVKEGMSATMGGPTTASADIIDDGKAKWKYLASATDALFVSTDPPPVSGFLEVSNITLDAQQTFNYAARLESSSQSRWTRVRFYLAKVDGCHLDAIGGKGKGNDSLVFNQCAFEICGQIFHSDDMPDSASGAVNVKIAGSKVTTKAGHREIIFSGSPKLLSLGIRRGDHIKIGNKTDTTPPDPNREEWLQIDSVDSDNRLTSCTRNPSSYNRSAQKWQIGVGDGYHEVVVNENNVNKHFNCLYRSAAGCGATFGGLYGPLVSGGQFDFVGAYGVSVGIQGFGSVITSTFERVYFEEIGAPASFWAGAASGLTINGVNTALPVVAFGNASHAVGVLIMNDQNDNGGLIKYAGDAMVSDILTRTIYRATARGTYRWLPGNAAISDATAQVMLPDASYIFLSSGDGLLSHEPTLSDGAADGQFIRLMNTQATNMLTLQDDSVLTRSKLQLATPRVTLAAYDSIDLLWQDGKWREVGRTIKTRIADTAG